LAKFFLIAAACSSGLFISATQVGKHHKLATSLVLVFSLFSVPLIVGYFHTAVALASMGAIIIVLCNLWRKRK
jgi:hypothetical protein